MAVVVSAMGHTTDELIDLAKQVCCFGGKDLAPHKREMDQLLATGEQVTIALMAMAIHALGDQAISFTGAQVGIVTDSTHRKARIKEIRTQRMRRALAEGNIVIVAGFQGIDEDFNITTLGRGGSDTTAVALAAVLNADACEIYTDVDGVFTTDPRLVAEARKMSRVSHDEILELASLGAGVMHSRSIEFGKKFNVPIHVRSSFNKNPGTMVVPEDTSMEHVVVSGVSLNRDEAKITVLGVPDQPGVAAKIFSPLAEANVNVDVIVQNISAEGRTDLTFTVARGDLKRALDVLNSKCKDLVEGRLTFDDSIAKVSIVGVGMRSHAGVAQKMFELLAHEGINILMISTSEIRISVVIDAKYTELAVRVLHDGFGLDKPPVLIA